MPSNSQYVTDEHATQINQALASIQMLRSELDLATRAGIDTTALKQKLDDSETRLRNIRQTYFTNI